MQYIVYQDVKIVPSKVICIGRNYVEHIHELGNEMPSSMVVFNKPNSAICSQLYYIDQTCRFEAEICFLMQQKKIVGVGVGLDLTKAEIQNELKQKGLPWERAKAFDHSAVFTPFIHCEGKFSSLEMKLFVNNYLAQHATYDLMIHKPEKIVEEINSFMHIEDGDVIMSGTPKGVSTYKRGDQFVIHLYRSGSLVLEHHFVAL